MTQQRKATSKTRPVSDVLEEIVRNKARRRGLLVWLDRHRHYDDFVDRLAEKSKAGAFPYPVVAFRGSFVETMFELEGEMDGREPRPMVVYVPGHNQDTIKQTPLFGVFRSGKRWRKALTTLVKEAAAGKVPTDALREFLESQGDELKLPPADGWLRAELSSARGQGSPLEEIPVTTQLERLLDGEPPASSCSLNDANEQMRTVLGVDEDWIGGYSVGKRGAKSFESLGRAAATWALATEFVEDLRRPPFAEVLEPIEGLPGTLVETCRDVAEHLRTYREDEYVRLARDFESRLEEERTQGDPSDLGNIDTFPFEEQVIFEASLEALQVGAWSAALDHAEHRDVSSCFWVRRERDRENRWRLVRRAVHLGMLLEEHAAPFADAASLEEAVQLYEEGLWKVDRAHRKLEQDRSKYLQARMQDFVEIRNVLDSMRQRYRRWADNMARAFNRLCDEQGFLATESLRQRTFFRDVIEPEVENHHKVALLMVDGLRFEMARDLMEALSEDSQTALALKPRLAELPTRTAVGMNVIPPVTQNGRLEPILGENGRISAMRSNRFQVRDGETRRKMMRHAVGGRACPGMSVTEILEGDEDLTRKIQNASLVVVHSGDIDTAGEKGHGLTTFERTLTDIRGAIRLLRKAGVERVVITADHGFLLQDDTTSRRIEQGKKTSPQARYSVSPTPENDGDRISASPQALSYEVGDQSVNFVFPRDTSLFDTGGALETYVHGGNSPQERIIPVLSMEAGKPGGSTRQFELTVDKRPPINDMQRIEVRVTTDQTALDFGDYTELELALRAPDDPGVDIELQTVAGASELKGDTFTAPLDEPVEVLFRATGSSQRQVPVEVRAPTMTDAVKAGRTEKRFAVEVRGTADESGDTESSSTGLEALPDDGTREVFEHLVKYESISESDATEILGSSVAFRQFSRNLEEYVERVSFDVKVESVDFQKLYRRVGDV